MFGDPTTFARIDIEFLPEIALVDAARRADEFEARALVRREFLLDCGAHIPRKPPDGLNLTLDRLEGSATRRPVGVAIGCPVLPERDQRRRARAEAELLVMDADAVVVVGEHVAAAREPFLTILAGFGLEGFEHPAAVFGLALAAFGPRLWNSDIADFAGVHHDVDARVEISDAESAVPFEQEGSLCVRDDEVESFVLVGLDCAFGHAGGVFGGIGFERITDEQAARALAREIGVGPAVRDCREHAPGVVADPRPARFGVGRRDDPGIVRNSPWG